MISRAACVPEKGRLEAHSPCKACQQAYIKIGTCLWMLNHYEEIALAGLMIENAS